MDVNSVSIILDCLSLTYSVALCPPGDGNCIHTNTYT